MANAKRVTENGRIKVKVWTVTTCVPGEPKPCMPSVFGTEADAEAFLNEMLRAEWKHHGSIGDDGEPLPYPGNWRAAVAAMAKENGGEWGQWEMTSHYVMLATADLEIEK